MNEAVLWGFICAGAFLLFIAPMVAVSWRRRDQ